MSEPSPAAGLAGRYEIARRIGEGGMAVVYLARDTRFDRLVALKELTTLPRSEDVSVSRASMARRFIRESRIAGGLVHPNVVTVLDFFEHDDKPYIAMEFVEGGSLRPYLPQLTLAQIGGVMQDTLAGLSCAESHGIVHRDLKPENLLVTRDGRIKIADFGIAKATSQLTLSSFQTEKGTTLGTPWYMSPEQARGVAEEFGPWTDLYSLGCIAYEIFTGRRPFDDSESPVSLLVRHVTEAIPPAISVVPSLDAGISGWIDRLLVKDIRRRTQRAADAWDELEDMLLELLGPRWARERQLALSGTNKPTSGPYTPPPASGPPGPLIPPRSGTPLTGDEPPRRSPAAMSESVEFRTYQPSPAPRPPAIEDAALADELRESLKDAESPREGSVAPQGAYVDHPPSVEPEPPTDAAIPSAPEAPPLATTLPPLGTPAAGESPPAPEPPRRASNVPPLSHEPAPTIGTPQPPRTSRRSQRLVLAVIGAVVVAVAVLLIVSVSKPGTRSGSNSTRALATVAGRRHSPAGGGNADQVMSKGRTVFESHCAPCHILADAPHATGTLGPNLDNVLKGKSAAFIRTSIVDPNALIAPGYRADVMPNFAPSFKPGELDALVNYLAHVAT